MKLLAFVLPLLIGCSTVHEMGAPVVAAMDQQSDYEDRLATITVGLKAGMATCYDYSKRVSRLNRAASDEVFSFCLNIVGPAYDVSHDAMSKVDHWNADEAQEIACTGKTADIAFTRLYGYLNTQSVPLPPIVEKAMSDARWLRERADDSCDPYHPTTKVTVYGAIPTISDADLPHP